MDSMAMTLAANHFFNVNDTNLTEEKAQMFHHIVANL